MLCTTHYIGDGMALHQSANDFFTLLGSDKDAAKLQEILDSEILERVSVPVREDLPADVESRLPATKPERIFDAIATVDHLLTQRKLIVSLSLFC